MFLGCSFPSVHIHLGVHKTATTYLQDHLERTLLGSDKVTYIPRETFREERKKSDYMGALNGYNKKLPLLISDENLLGNCSAVLSGSFYGRASRRINRIIQDTNTDSVKIFISIRSVTRYLSSAYCEYLRNGDRSYLSFNDYIKNLDVERLSWYAVFKDAIRENPEVDFYIFNFDRFRYDKERLLKLFSLGFVVELLDDIAPSRASFSNDELYSLSGGALEITGDDKFDPFGPNEHAQASNNLKADIEKLSELKNVFIINE